MAGAVGGLLALPTWANSWTAKTLHPTRQILTREQAELLAELVETIIPTTDTPGAKELNVHQFVQKMVADCYPTTAQNTLQQGLDSLNNLADKSVGKPFADGSAEQRTTLLTQLAQDPDQKGFYSLVKGLTIRGYMSSEYVMTNLTHYQFIPGHYYGCVPVAQKEQKTASQGK